MNEEAPFSTMAIIIIVIILVVLLVLKGISSLDAPPQAAPAYTADRPDAASKLDENEVRKHCQEMGGRLITEEDNRGYPTHYLCPHEITEQDMQPLKRSP